MNDNVFDSFFAAHGYNKIGNNFPFLDFYLHDPDSDCTPVVIMINSSLAEAAGAAEADLPEEERIWKANPGKLDAEDVEMFTDTIWQTLKSNGYSNCEYLYILVTEDPALGKKLFPNKKNYWEIRSSERLLLAYEDIAPLFSPLQKDLELFLFDDPEEDSDAHAFDPTIRGTCITLVLVAINVLLFLYGALFPAKGSAMFSMGALNAQQVFEQHEWYRLFTSMFLHLSGDHIFNNMITLLFIGSYMEHHLGHWRYLTLYLVSGLLAGCTSIVYNVLILSASASVGASGAIYGLMGALLLTLFLNRDREDSPGLPQIFFMIFWIVYGSFISPDIDYAAHMGGLVSGLALYILLTLSKEKGIQTHDEG